MTFDDESDEQSTFGFKTLLPSNVYDRFMFNNSKAYFENQLKTAATYDEWKKAALKLDEIDGLDAWKRNPKSSEYDWELIQTRLAQLREIRSSNKGQTAMIFVLRSSLTRNLGDIGNPKLYSHSRVGTKYLASEYIEEVVKQLNWICDEPADPIEDPSLDLKAKHDFFMNMRQSFGRTALLLSGGGTLGLNHMGVIKCLHEKRLLPRIISGASSGSIMASLVCTKTDDEIQNIFDPASIQLDVFERNDYPETPLMRLQRLLASGQLFDVDILRDALRGNLGDITFQEAFNRTRWILNITVSSSTLYDMPRLLNYLTAPNVVIWSAVAASCAVPVFYGSTPLYAKDKNGKVVPWNPSDQLYIDGSVENDLPMNKLSELFNVNHFIVCQVNPHVIPFIQKTNTPSKMREMANFCMHMAKVEAQHRCTQLTELGIMSSFFYKIQSVMSQKYSGDITIIPEIGYSDFLKVLSNPTPDYAMTCLKRGDRATWPKMSIIKNHLQIELTIDQIIYRLRLSRLSELQNMKLLSDSKIGRGPRPSYEMRSVSQNNISSMNTIDESDDEETSSPRKHTELFIPTKYNPKTNDGNQNIIPDITVQLSQSTPLVIQLSEDTPKILVTEKKSQKQDEQSRRERRFTKRGLQMTKPE